MRKTFNRVLGLALTVVMLAVACIAPASAAAVCECGEAPLIVVNGIGSVPLLKDDGTGNMAVVFEQSQLEDITAALITGFARLIAENASFGAGKDWNGFCDEVLPPIYNIIDPISYNTDGTPKYPEVVNAEYPVSLAEYPEEEREAFQTVFGELMGEEIGYDHVYIFGYDWRADPIVSAGELDAFIDTVKAATGHDEVNLLGMSMGANIVLAYLSEFAPANNFADLKNVVFAAPAWQGTSLAGDVFTNNIKVSAYTLENFLVQMADGNIATHIAALVTSFIATWQGLTADYIMDIDAAVQGCLPRVYSDIVIPQLAGMPGLWSLLPAEYFEDAKAFIFPDGMDANLEVTVDAYHDIQVNAKAVIEAAKKAKVNFSIVCGYDYQIIPVGEKCFNTSDTLIDTVYASGGATCAHILKEYEFGYSQKFYDGHNHVSPDLRIDASTCMFPENTWFIKDIEHVNYQKENNTTGLIMWLLLADRQPTVTTDVENYPQYFELDTYNNTCVAYPQKEYRLMGDIDNNGFITTDDARFALRASVGLVNANPYQRSKGDIDGDGKITTDDARSIMRMAVELEEWVYIEAPAEEETEA